MVAAFGLDLPVFLPVVFLLAVVSPPRSHPFEARIHGNVRSAISRFADGLIVKSVKECLRLKQSLIVPNEYKEGAS